MSAQERLELLKKRKQDHEQSFIAKDDLSAEIIAVYAAIRDYEQQIERIKGHMAELYSKIGEFQTRRDAIIIPPEVTKAEIEQAERMAKE